ncbi:MAG: PAS domain-containing protein [Nitrospirae bacterium]|nr:PAS domain-containing protein [Nitrospirota bacterium]
MGKGKSLGGQIVNRMFDHTSYGIILIDGHRRVVGMNPAAEAITGLRKEEMIGRRRACYSLFGCHHERGRTPPSDLCSGLQPASELNRETDPVRFFCHSRNRIKLLRISCAAIPAMVQDLPQGMILVQEVPDPSETGEIAIIPKKLLRLWSRKFSSHRDTPEEREMEAEVR